jgi:CHAP domain
MVMSTLRTLARRRSLRLAMVVASVAIVASACLPPPPPDAPLPAPTWWSGSCDSGNYGGAHPLGATYRGVDVCGPRPGADGAPNRLVRFFPGAWGELEWQCVELSMRFMYVAYGVSPYGANGKDVVDNYTTASGGGLVRIANGTGVAPAPGDVISFGATGSSPLGHTAVVESANVDGSGNGSIRLLSQNDTTDGWRTVSVSNWWVNGPAGGLGGVGGWLHKP